MIASLGNWASDEQAVAGPRKSVSVRRAAVTGSPWSMSEGLTAALLSAPVSGSSPGYAGCAMACPGSARRAGARRRTAKTVDGSDRSGLGLGCRTARRGALRARSPAQNRRAAAHATRSGARGAQKLQTAPSGRKPGTQAARRSQALAPPSRSDGAARTSAAVDRSGPAVGGTRSAVRRARAGADANSKYRWQRREGRCVTARGRPAGVARRGRPRLAARRGSRGKAGLQYSLAAMCSCTKPSELTQADTERDSPRATKRAEDGRHERRLGVGRSATARRAVPRSRRG